MKYGSALITTYSDPKMMLHKKMSTLTNFKPLWKTSNSEKNIRCFNQNNELNQISDEFSRKKQYQRKALKWRWFRENIPPARRFKINKMVDKIK